MEIKKKRAENEFMLLIKRKFSVFFIFLSVLYIGIANTSVHNVAYAATLTVDETFKVAAINDRSTMFVAHNSMTYFDILHSSQAFSDDSELNNKNSRLWISTQLHNSGFSDIPLVLNIDRLNINDLQIYLVDKNSRIIKSYRYQAGKGDFSLPIILPAIRFTFSLSPYEDARLLIGVYDDGLRHFPITVWNNQEIQHHDRTMLVLLGVVLGMLTIFTGYFLLSYLYQRTPARFWLAMSNSALFAVIFIAQGGLTAWPSLTNGSEIAFAIIFTLSLVMLAKVTHNLFVRIPTTFRIITYAAPITMGVISLVGTSYNTTIILLIGYPIIGLYHIAMALIFNDRRNKPLSRLFAFSWLFIFMLYALVIELLLGDLFVNTTFVVIVLALLTMALLCMGFSVELKEQSYNRQQLSERDATINNLNHFYDLFRNSAEGLYTSTLDGTLKTVNPAMCALFGYKDENEMLEQVKNTQQFYADVEDRDVLLGELLESGQVMGRDIKGVRSDGSTFWFSISCQVRKNENGNFLYGSIFDVTEKIESNLNLQFIATHDSLTGTYNRRQFEQTLKTKLSKKNQQPICILYLDVDRFKIINDTSGHKAGDALIKEISQVVKKALPDNTLLARLDGDEFGVIFDHYDDDQVYLTASHVLNAIQAHKFMWDNRIFNLSVSIGMVVCKNPKIDTDQYLSMANAACDFAKEQGRNQIHRYSENDVSMTRYQQELNWITTINHALSNNLFVLYYQHLRPLKKPNDGYYYEVLLRLQETDGSIIDPSSFLPTAERFEMNVTIDKWVISNVFEWLSKNQTHLSKLKRCSINLNCHSLTDRDFKLFVLNAFDKFNIPYEKICFEIIESVAIIKMDDTIDFMRTFSNLGCVFALDDFGSGFSSYRYLKNLPVNVIKIDGSFIKDMLNDPVNAAMVASINDVARAMNILTVAEYVESEATMAQLGKMGIDFAQGFSVATPAPLVEFKPL